MYQDKGKDTCACDPYVSPFRTCWQEHHENLYKLVELDVNQIKAREVELDHRFDEKGTLEPVMDWSAWLDFLKEERSLERAEDDCAQWRSLDKFVPLWRRFMILERKPFLVNVSAKVPTKYDNRSLFAVYALDQDSLVAGYSEGDSSGVVPVTIVPGMTKSLTVKALYKENSKSHPRKKTYAMDAILCVSQEMSLTDMAKKVAPKRE